MAQHTPGPWEALESSERCPLPAGVCVEVNQVSYKGGRLGTICEMIAQESGGKYSPDVTNANAHLMAASPDLLAACKAALSRFVEPENCFYDGTETNDLLREAIAKAEGKE